VQAFLGEAASRGHRQFATDQRWTFDRLGLLTARLLNALDARQVYEILAQHLPAMGVKFAAVAMLEPEGEGPHCGEDPFAWAKVRTVVPVGGPEIRNQARKFPPDGLLPADDPFSLAVLPLVNPRGQLGFVAFDSAQLDLYGSIVQQFAAALHASQLYAEAQEGRRLAEEATQMKSRFLSTVSHELRTPLNLIVGLSEILLREQAVDSLAQLPAGRHDLERLHANARHLSRLISDVLDLASSDAGRLRLSCQYVNLAEVLSEVGRDGRTACAEQGPGVEGRPGGA
jgi:hypothetical protein